MEQDVKLPAMYRIMIQKDMFLQFLHDSLLSQTIHKKMFCGDQTDPQNCPYQNYFIRNSKENVLMPLLLVNSPKRCLETYCFCSVSSSYYYYYYYYSPFFLCDMNMSTADFRYYWTEFHETWWSFRYMFLLGPKVFSFVVKGVKVIF